MGNFWRVWLNAWCYVVILFGFGLSGAGIEGFERFAETFLWYLGDQSTLRFNELERFSLGLVGAITVGWGLTLLYYIQMAHYSNEGNRVWRRLIGVLLVWYVIDGYISYRTGFTLNIASNSVIFLAFFVPLYLSGKLKR